MWLRGHSRSLKVVTFESLGTVSHSPSIVTMVVSVAVCEIFSVKEWRDLENQVMGRSRSLKMAPFDRSYTTYYVSAIVIIAVCCTIFNLLDIEYETLKRSLKVIHTGTIRKLGVVSYSPSIFSIALSLTIYIDLLKYGCILHQFRDKA